MKTGHKRWPRLKGGRLRPVVAVVLDDGTQLPVNDSDLRAYLESDLERAVAQLDALARLGPHGLLKALEESSPRAVFERLMKQLGLDWESLAKAERARTAARFPRRKGKSATQDELERLRKQYLKTYKTEHGFTAYAARSLKVHRSTIARRLKTPNVA